MNEGARAVCSMVVVAGLVMVRVALAHAASLQPQRGGWAAEGEGLTSCADFEKAYKAAPDRTTDFFAWTQGYLSGMDQTLKSEGGQITDLGLWNEEKQVQFISAYCAAHPTEACGDATTQLFLAIRAREGIPTGK